MKYEEKKSQQSFDMFYWLLFDVCKVYCEDKSLVAKDNFQDNFLKTALLRVTLFQDV